MLRMSSEGSREVCDGNDAGRPAVGRSPRNWSAIRGVGPIHGFRCARSTPLLRNQEFTFHPLEALRSIAFDVEAIDEHRAYFRRLSDPPPGAPQTPEDGRAASLWFPST